MSAQSRTYHFCTQRAQNRHGELSTLPLRWSVDGMKRKRSREYERRHRDEGRNDVKTRWKRKQRKRERGGGGRRERRRKEILLEYGVSPSKVSLKTLTTLALLSFRERRLSRVTRGAHLRSGIEATRSYTRGQEGNSFRAARLSASRDFHLRRPPPPLRMA